VQAQPKASKQAEFAALMEKKIQRMKQREWKIRLSTKFSISIRGQIERILSILDAVRDLGSLAASLDPVHAALPVAGLYIILGVSTLFFNIAFGLHLLRLPSSYLATSKVVKY
jgi:hypothetical protein